MFVYVCILSLRLSVGDMVLYIQNQIQIETVTMNEQHIPAVHVHSYCNKITHAATT